MKILLVAFVASILAHAQNADSPIIDSADPYADLRRAMNAHNQEHVQQIALKERLFVQAFNNLAETLHDFSESYRASHSIDAQKVKAIRKAYRRLQALEPWFDLENGSVSKKQTDN